MVSNGVNSAGRSQRDYKRLLVTTSLATLMTANFAAAQEANPIQLNTIVIDANNSPVGPDNGYIAKNTTTGSKTNTPLREIPQSVSVITREQMDDRSNQRIEDTLAYTAGVTASPWGVDDRFTQVNIRGFDAGSNSMFRDGLAQRTIDFSGFKIEPYGLERVEVLKGPASVLYGENEVGGVINAVTKRPTKDPLYSAYASYGSFNTYEVGLDAGGPLDKDGVWTYRLTGLFRDGEQEKKFSENDRVFIAPAITWSPSADTSLTVLANYQWDKLTPNYFLPLAGVQYPAAYGQLSRSFTTADPNFDRFHANHGSIGYDFEHTFNEAWTIRQKVRYSAEDTDYRHLYYSNSMIDDRIMPRTAFTVDQKATAFNVDNNAEYTYESALIKNTLLIGLDYNRYTLDGQKGFGDGPTLDILNPVYGLDVVNPPIYEDMRQTISQVGLYAQTHAKIDDHWLITLGGRQAWVDNKTNNRLNPVSSTDQSDQAFTWQAGLGYLFDNGMTPYVSYSESFKTNLGVGAQGAFEPTKGTQYEAGIKYEPDFFPGTVTASVFQITKTNVTTPDLSDPTNTIQTGEIRHKGVELESVVNLFHGVSLTGSYTYLDAEITSSNTVGEQGNRPSLVPEHQASLWAKYNFDTGLLQGLNVGAGVRYVGSSFGDNANKINIGAYTLVDAELSYEKNGWKGSLKASNLFDKSYYGNCSADGSGVNPMCIYGEGRTLKGTLSAKF
ncbi:TonB-dependent siderophore receptor (plasmid) [Phyllobacterium sp. 628]|uniref:TonB-dependent siderophore receptor n=1 Tax=Phyllobacterium sp. 628 TaxID=2718938 RepID=UPI00166225C9|nr:TonB-dependent siderophore receptor [Phyllobacterium sp. 628]QND50607.1 TonB-dependent siderophore receptor [Phyllobacterium sp. 628]